MKIKAVITDLDDTLFDTRKLYNIALLECLAVYNRETGQSLTDKEFRELYNKARQDFKKVAPNGPTSHNRAIYFQKLVENLTFQTSYDLAYKLYATYYDFVYKNVKPFPGVIDLFTWLRREGKKIGVVSDGNSHIRLEKLHYSGLADYVDAVVSSEEVGIDKPSPQGLMLILQKLDVQADEAIYIGNSQSSDMGVAKQLGLPSIQVLVSKYDEDITETPVDDPDFTVEDIPAIKPILLKLENQEVA